MQNPDQTAVQVTASALLVAALMSLSSGAQAGSPGEEVAYTGRATVIDVTARVLGSTIRQVRSDTGELEPDGSTRETHSGSYSNPMLGIRASLLPAVTSGAGNVAASNAAVARLLVNQPGLQISADVIEAHAEAECHRSSMTVSTRGNATLANLRINGTPVDAAQPANTRLDVPGVASIVINEQYNPDVNTQVVNALHVTVHGLPGMPPLADVVIAHARAGIFSCPCD